MAWFGFWIAVAVFVAGEYCLFSQGYETALHTHKTPEEKEIQRLKIDSLKAKAHRNGD